MNPDFWLDRWARNQIGFHQTEVNPYLRSHWSRIATSNDTTVFVPLCGKSLDMWWLHELGHRVVGVELSRAAIADFFGALRIEPRIDRRDSIERWTGQGYTLLCGDFFALTSADLRDVAYVFDRASLVALPDDMRSDYARKMRATLPSDAITLLVTVTYPQQEMSGPPFSVDEPEVRRLYADGEVEKLLDVDVLLLEENARFKQRGMTSMTEQVYRITKAS